MAGLVIDYSKCVLCGLCERQCPFKAIEIKDKKVEISAACKMCRICLNNCPTKAIIEEKDEVKEINKDEWRDILVYVEHSKGKIHPVTLELINKAKELASVINQDVKCLMIGHDISDKADELLDYGIKEVLVYEDEELEYFRSDSYKEVFVDCIDEIKPTVVLVGATVSGRSLAPRVAAYYRTGLTADCTVLEMRENTDLVQIRPAFGGNIMAQILNTNHRPQFATVRYKVFDEAKKCQRIGKVTKREIDKERIKSKIEILDVFSKPKETSITDAEILVTIGRGVKEENIEKVEKIAEYLGAMVSCTRPLVESGHYEVNRQIGLSGRTVKPKLIITFGVSGAIQFTAGMNNAELIIAVNIDEEAPIFDIAHVAVIKDVNILIEEMLKELERKDV